MNKRVALLIVLHNSGKDISRLLTSIKKQAYNNIEIYLFDNNSADNSVKIVKNHFPSAKIFSSKNNIGYGAANNIIAKEALKDGADYLFILNPDMELHDDCIKELAKAAELYNAGIVGPIVFYGNGSKDLPRIEYFGVNVNFKNRKFKNIYNGKYFEKDTIPEMLFVSVLHGGAIFISSNLFIQLGAFEEMYYMYGEEIDIGYRTLKAGHKSINISKAIVSHYHNWSSQNKEGYYFMYYYMLRNRYLYFIKFNLYSNLIYDIIKEIFLFPVKIRWAIKTADIKLIKYYYLGMVHGLLNKKGKADIEFK